MAQTISQKCVSIQKYSKNILERNPLFFSDFESLAVHFFVDDKNVLKLLELCEDEENFYVVREYVGISLLLKLVTISENQIIFGESHAAIIVV